MAIVYSSGCQSGRNFRPVNCPRSLQPYQIRLDEVASVLQPTPGEMQCFCYGLAFNPADPNAFVPMEYVVLGVGQGIGLSDFENIAVSINGVSQAVTLGGNVYFVSGEGANGCAGLKLVFPLANATDEMHICLTMKHTCSYGLMNACFYGSGVSSQASIPGPLALQTENCPTTSYQEVEVCVPVTISPYATVGEVTVTCCGAPTVTAGTEGCSGVVGGTCSFTVSQRVCVAVPVTFGANTVTGDYAVSCGGTGEGGCEGCAAAALREGMNAGARSCQQCRGVNQAQTTQIQDFIENIKNGKGL